MARFNVQNYRTVRTQEGKCALKGNTPRRRAFGEREREMGENM